jgi:hypothetical protein
MIQNFSSVGKSKFHTNVPLLKFRVIQFQLSITLHLNQYIYRCIAEETRYYSIRVLLILCLSYSKSNCHVVCPSFVSLMTAQGYTVHEAVIIILTQMGDLINVIFNKLF